jgi:hypothetical protein
LMSGDQYYPDLYTGGDVGYQLRAAG